MSNTVELKEKHTDLCLSLNMDASTEKRSWEAFSEIQKNYALDGVQTHWLCCSLYVACRKPMIPTVGNSEYVVEGNCVSLTRLLRTCDISLTEFFNKIKKWCEMASLPAELRNRIDRLERNYIVATLLYQKFIPIFRDLFICPATDDARVGKGKKVKSIPCTANKVFELCWCLFICAKGEFPQYSVDLVTSFNLLLCCADLIFSNAFVDNRRDLINSNFPRIPEQWKKGEKLDHPICVVEQLSERHEGTMLDAMELKRYNFNELIKKFFDKKILIGDSENFMGLLSMGNFETNLKSLNNLYETFTLNCGEFDERIFLNHADIGSNRLGGSAAKKPRKMDMDNQMSSYDESSGQLTRGTPITRRDCLPDANFLTPVTAATQSVNRLRLMLKDYAGKPQAGLMELFQQCDNNPEAKIRDTLDVMSRKFCDNFKPNGEERFRLAEALFYRLLENTIRSEKRKSLDLNTFLNHEMYFTSLIVCSVEIVLTAYNSQRKFPWILEILDMEAYNFYKIIEIVVLRQQDLLTREVIKHLNTIEEQCLESYIWMSKSPIWERIKNLDKPIPTNQDVSRRSPNELSAISNSSNSGTEQPRQQLQLNNSSLNQNGYGSLGLFFRKFYELAYPRMKTLCTDIGLHDDNAVKKIWTIFEYSIVERTQLMKDRHLDQILMCAIYVFNRVKKLEKNFSDIMKFYRNQPQADSHVYRSVLISHKNETEVIRPDTAAPVPEGPSAPSDLAGMSTSHDNEERGDIIKFYNTVYVPQMQEFAFKFSDQNQLEQVPLSPLPMDRCSLLSPKRISANHSLFIGPFERNESVPESPASITYHLYSSPAKDLNKLNKCVANGRRTFKRLLPFDEDQPINTEGYSASNQKLQNIINDREHNDGEHQD